MKTKVKRLSKRTLAMLLSILMMVSIFMVGTISANAAGTNWNANIFFRVPDSWNLSTYPNVQAWAVQSTSASSGTKYAFLLGNMSVAGTTSNSRLYHAWVSANHTTWGNTEYIAFTANTSNWKTGDFYISTCGQYTKPLNYGATNGSGSYLFTPSNASNNTATNDNTISGSYNKTNRDVLKKAQDFYVYTDGSAGATGGSVKVDAYYLNGSSYSGSSAIATSDITVNTSDTGAHEQYSGAVEGTKVTLTATPDTGYKLQGYYDAATGGNEITSPYYVFGTKSVYARFVKKTYAITLSETGGSGTMKIDGTARSSGYAVTHGNHTFSVEAPTGKVVKSISGIGTWSGVGTDTATLGSTSITEAKTINVTYEDAGTCGLTLDSTSGSVNIGETKTITVTPNAYHSGGTISASSSSTSVATASYNSSTGKVTVTGVANGTATITVSCTEGGSATYSVTVNKPTITVANNTTLKVGGTYNPSPTLTNPSSTGSGWTVVYTKQSGTTASVSGSTITGEGYGSATTFKASYRYNDVEKASTTFTVTPATPAATFSNYGSLTIGSTKAATLSGVSNVDNLTRSFEVTEGSDYISVDSSTGTVTALASNGSSNGSGEVTVYYKKGSTTILSKTATVTVTKPTIAFASTSAATINIGGTATRAASNKSEVGTVTSDTTTYSSSNTAVATVSSSGVITGVTPGSATISAKRTIVCGGKTTEVSTSTNISVTVNTPSITQGNVTIAKGDSKTLSTATTNPSSGLTVTFALSGSPNGVTCTSAGKVTVTSGSTASTATVVATAKKSDDTTVATKNITITIQDPSLTVKDGNTSVADGTVYTTVGTNKTLTVGTNFSGDLTVKSSNTSIATVSLSGTTLTITPRAKGTTKVSVSTDSSYTPALLSASSSPKLLLGASPTVATQTVTFTVNVAEADTYHYVYFSNGGNWSSPVIHAWGSSATPANRAAMTKIGVNNLGQDVYAYRFSATDWAKVQNIHFLSSSSATWNDSSNSDNTHTFTGTELSHNGFYNDGTYDLTLVKPQIQASDVTIDMGSTKTMTATVLTSGTPSTYNWSSGTTSVATTANTHTASNVITGVAPGTSTITIKAYAEKPTGWTSIVTDGSADNFVAGTTTATATVVAENKTITNNGAYYKTGSAAYASGTTGGTFSVSQTGSLAYNTNLTLTATAASGYAVEGIYWSTDGTTWTKVATTDTKTNGYVTTSTNNTFKVTDNFQLKAQFVQVLRLSAFDSYELKNNQVSFVTAPPKSITIKHTDAHGTATTYTYSYDGTKTKGNPDSPDGTKPAALAIASGSYGQGNYIRYYAGDEITLTYSAMASSEILKGVFYDNTKNFYVNKPTTAQFVEHSHPATPAIYMNGAYYTSAQLGSRDFSGVTADNDAHSVKFTGTQDYKNIDVEIGTKRKVYFSDYTNTVITSKNLDDYYYDSEDLSVTGDQLTVAAKKSATQTNKIVGSGVKFCKATESGGKGTELTSTEISNLNLSITNSNSESTSSADGTALVISGKMPAYDLYIDLNMQNSYTLKLGTKIVSDLGGTATRLATKATVKINTLSALTTADVTTNSTSVATGNTATLSVTNLTSGYMFVGWYWGDASAPDYENGFISDKQSFSYAPKKGGIIWAVGTKELFINGSKYITGKATDWYSENNTWKNQQMKFDPDRGTQGSYYWEITDTMFASAGSDFKYTSSNSGDTGGSNTEGKYFKGNDNAYYWCNNEDSKHGKAFFQFVDTETGYANREVWKSIYSFLETADGTTHGKIIKRDMNQAGNTDEQRLNGQGFIDFAESRYSGYSSPLRIYLNAATKDLDVVATAIYSNLYVSNGYNVGSTLKTDAVTVQPVVDGVVKTSGQTGYFTIAPQGNGWEPGHEGHVSHYIPQKKGATVRITKEARGSDKIAAFLIYDIDERTVRAERNLTKGTTANDKTPYYFDLTLANEKQNLYIVPIVEEAGAKVTITFDASQLNRKQWGDIVSAYSWYKTTNAAGLGEYPGQPMIPSDDMSTWTTTFAATKGGNELAGITFTNYVDGTHSWLGCSGVMGTVTYGGAGTQASPTTVSIADDGIIKQYNYIESGDNKEYSRANYKAQTYDYHEPIALYDRYKKEDSINITFQMKDGNSSLISWYHKDLVNTSNSILNPSNEKWRLNFEYLTNAKGDQYIDMNGNPLGANNKPTASFYVASKGLAVYKNSTMKYLFDSGQNYEMQGYEATYSRGTGDRGSYTRKTGGWSSAINYGGVSGLDMKYAVQWYVYDAQGNYITTVLSAGIADLASGSTDTYIANQLENMGYAVDGKSVAICYDKPRYMYGDWEVTNSADNINSGPNFDAYRFEGQWIAAGSTDTVKVNVGVGMMTDSGEVLADSNTAAYGNATASLRSGITFKEPYAIAANDGSWAQTAATDAKLNGIALNASATNFIGWYYYDANTGDFTKATYTSNENFYPNYTNKDVTYYAVYRAAAVYNYIYTGREGERTYSASGEDLKEAEMSDNKVVYTNHSADVLAKLPVGIGVFKKNIDFSDTNAASWDKDNNTQYILKLSGFSVTQPTYTLTAHYKNASGELVTITDSAIYNDKAVNLTKGEYTDSKGGTKPADTAVTTYYGTEAHKFIGWYEYDNGEKGDLLSTQANFGMRLTKKQDIIAVYDEDSQSLPTDGWKAFIDENQVNKELTTKDTGVFYNDTIVRVRKGSDVKATLPNNAKIGVLVVCDNKTDGTINGYDNTQLNTLVTKVASGKTMKTSGGISITNMQAANQTEFNRTDIAVRSDYAKNNGAKYCVYAYIYDGTTYHFSAASAVKTYE